MENDNKNRFNKIVTQALNTSPYSRHLHDTYYTERKRYSYSTTPKATFIAQVQFEVSSNKMKLILNMGKNDNDLVCGVHHELIHVGQNIEFEKQKVAMTPDKMSVTDFVAKTIAIEVHAKNAEQEGPLLGFVRDLADGKMDRIDAYKAYTENTREDAVLYTAALLNEPQLKGMTAHNAVDHIGYRFMNDRDLETKLDFTAARCAMVGKFISKSAIQNNPTLDHYIGNALQFYQKNGPKLPPNALFGAFEDVFQSINDLFGEGTMSGMGGATLHDPTLGKLSQVLKNKDDMFLTLPQWQQTLKAENNEAFVDQLMFGSKHRALYGQLVQKNRDDGWLP